MIINQESFITLVFSEAFCDDDDDEEEKGLNCKRGNIRGTLIFANFAQNSASANSKTR